MRGNVVKTSVTCYECGHATKTENGMKIHKKDKHEVPELDGSIFISKKKLSWDTNGCIS